MAVSIGNRRGEVGWAEDGKCACYFCISSSSAYKRRGGDCAFSLPSLDFKRLSTHPCLSKMALKPLLPRTSGERNFQVSHNLATECEKIISLNFWQVLFFLFCAGKRFFGPFFPLSHIFSLGPPPALVLHC